jgi:O-antigen/teichoic acid export membrane protein
MARGRSRALLGYGVAHFVVYIGAVVVASRWGLGGVAVSAVVVHGIFLVIAYQVMLHDRPEPVLSVIWSDVSAATTSCAVLALAAVPTDLLLDGVGAPAIVQIVAVSAVAAVAYLGTLRLCFDDAWGDLASLLRRVLPARPVRATVPAEPVAAGRAS